MLLNGCDVIVHVYNVACWGMRVWVCVCVWSFGDFLCDVCYDGCFVCVDVCLVLYVVCVCVFVVACYFGCVCMCCIV